MNSSVSIPTVICIVVFAMLIMHVLTVVIEMYNIHIIRAMDSFFMEEIMRRNRYECFDGAQYSAPKYPTFQGPYDRAYNTGSHGPLPGSHGIAAPEAYSPVISELPIAATPVDVYQQDMAQVEGLAYDPYATSNSRPTPAYPDSLVRGASGGRGSAPKNVNTFYF